jgi:hypothetical protein
MRASKASDGATSLGMSREDGIALSSSHGSSSLSADYIFFTTNTSLLQLIFLECSCTLNSPFTDFFAMLPKTVLQVFPIVLLFIRNC